MAVNMDVNRFTKSNRLSGAQLYFFVLLEQQLNRLRAGVKLDYKNIVLPKNTYFSKTPYYSVLKYARSKGFLKGLDYKFLNLEGKVLDLEQMCYEFKDRYADYFEACRENGRVILDVERLLKIGIQDDYLLDRGKVEFVLLHWLAYFVAKDVLKGETTSLFILVEGASNATLNYLVAFYRVMDILALKNIIVIEGLSKTKMSALGELAFTTDRKEMGLLKAEGYSADEKYQFVLDNEDIYKEGSVVYLYERKHALGSTADNSVSSVEVGVVTEMSRQGVELLVGFPSVTKEQRMWEFTNLPSEIQETYYLGELPEVILRRRRFGWSELGVDGVMSDKLFDYFEDYFITGLDYKQDGIVTQVGKDGKKRDFTYNQAIYNILKSYGAEFDEALFRKNYL